MLLGNGNSAVGDHEGVGEAVGFAVPLVDVGFADVLVDVDVVGLPEDVAVGDAVEVVEGVGVEDLVTVPLGEADGDDVTAGTLPGM